MHHDVFISYSSLDKPIADAACATLEAQGIRCWVAPRDIMPGQDWSDAIIDAISDCQVFVLVLSSASNQSEQVKREVQNAVSEAKPILPFRIEPVSLSKHMRYFIGTPHWLDALTPPMEFHLQRMGETIKGLIRSLEIPTEESIPPPSPASPPNAFPWDADRLSQIEAELRLFVGPFGAHLIQQAATEAQGYDDLCSRLSERLTSESERAAFLRKCAPLRGEREKTGAPAKTISATVARSPVISAPVISASVMAAAEKNLAQFMGPIAPVLVAKAARDADNMTEFLRLLAEHVPTPAEKAKFLRQMG